MHAFLYRLNYNRQDYIFATYKNSSDEIVSIPYIANGIYQIVLSLGNVNYDQGQTDIIQYIKDKYPVSENICNACMKIGRIVKHVWRPGYIDHKNPLEIEPYEETKSKKELGLLIKRLEDIILYIEPDEKTIETYGHKTRELLLLSCTEFESRWLHYLNISGNIINRPTTNDYIKIKDKLFLHEYEICFSSHPYSINICPFKNWDTESPTQSLPFYHSYNKLKHDTYQFFSQATLYNCIISIMANIVMHCVRYSPYSLLEGKDTCSTLFNEYFSIKLVDPSINTFYVPHIKSVQMASGAFSAPPGSTFSEDWIIDNFTI